MLATPPDKEKLKNGSDRLKIEKIEEGEIQFLEDKMDLMDQTLEPMTHFILPGGHTRRVILSSYCLLCLQAC